MYTVPIIFAVISVIGGVLSSVRQFQMLQQNSYFAVRYLRWYKGSNSPKRLIYLIIAIAVAIGVFFALQNNMPIPLLVTCGLFLTFTSLYSIRKNESSIKKLVVTARIKRMFAAETLLLILVGVLSVLIKGIAGNLLTALLFGLAAIPELLTLISLTIMKPIEKMIANHYLNDAKSLLRSKSEMKVIGVTGSYGKTSTKYILGRILSEKYNTLITPENYNTPMGVVITVRRDLTPQTEVFVVEMGAKRKGDIAEICDIVLPDLAVITSVGPQHLDTFGNIETVVSTKFELADFVKQKNGTAYLNSDNSYIKTKVKDYSSVTYGTKDADLVAENIKYTSDGSVFDIKYKDVRFTVNTKLLGTHNVLNIAAAAAVALDLGLTTEQIAYAIAMLKPVEHRLQMKRYIGGSTLIDDAYNSNPEGCLEAVRVLGSFEGMKKIIVTPGLVELGDKEYECNKRLGLEAAKHCDTIILVGKKRSIPLVDGIKETNFDEQNLYVVSSFAEAVTVFSKMCDANTVILFENDLPDNYLE